MQTAPIPANEQDRLKSLERLCLLDTPPEERFDRITRLAIHLFKVQISTITLIDLNREWFKSAQGLANKEGDRAVSFCGHALLTEDIFIIPDATKDQRFDDNPMVTHEPHIHFYAGVPIFSADGKRIGVFCIKDQKSRNLSDEETTDLKSLASWVELEINTGQLRSAFSEKTAFLQKLERLNRLMVGRELMMVQLKKEIQSLKK